MSRPRDSQRSKVYAAIRSVPAHRHSDGYDYRQLVERVTRSKWWEDHGGRTRNPPIGPGWCDTDLMTLAALVHHVLPAGVAWHGVEFCQLYLSIVSRFLGVEKRKEVRAAFRQHGVKTFRRSQAAREAARQRYQKQQAVNDLLAIGQRLRSPLDGGSDG